jgi:hypothetical protein
MKHYTDLLTNLIGEWEKGGAKKKACSYEQAFDFCRKKVRYF